MDLEAIQTLLELAGSIGAPAVAVILGMKYAINGMREDVREIKVDVKEIKDKQEEQATKLAVLEDRNVRVDAS